MIPQILFTHKVNDFVTKITLYLRAFFLYAGSKNQSIVGLLSWTNVRLDLSPRSYHRVIKLARTIADLADEKNIKSPHILEALQYRPKQLI